jgi:hypothetical protein
MVQNYFKLPFFLILLGIMRIRVQIRIHGDNQCGMQIHADSDLYPSSAVDSDSDWIGFNGVPGSGTGLGG